MASFDFAFDDEQFSDRRLLICVSAGAARARKKRRGAAAEAEGGAPVHTLNIASVILARASPYFRALLGGAHGMREAAAKEVKIEVAEVEEAHALKAALKALYDEKFEPTDDAAPIAVLRACDQYELKTVFSMVATNLAAGGQMSIDAACTILELPESITADPASSELLALAKSKLLTKFRDLGACWRGDEWLQLKPDALLSLLMSDELEAPSENTVFRAVERWLRSCLEKHFSTRRDRGAFVLRLLEEGALRLGCLRSSFLLHLARSEACFFLNEGDRLGVAATYRRLLDNAMTFHLSSDIERVALFKEGAEREVHFRPRPGAQQKPKSTTKVEFSLTHANFAHDNAIVRFLNESEKIFIDGYEFYMFAKRFAGKEAGHSSTLGLFCSNSNGCITNISCKLKVLNRTTQQWTTAAEDDETILPTGVAWGHGDCLEMGAQGWSAAVDSGEGAVRNPYVGPGGSVKVQVTVRLNDRLRSSV